MTDEVTTPKPKKTAVVALAVLAVLLLGSTGTFGALYSMERETSAELVRQRDHEVADLTKRQQDAYGKMLSADARASDWESKAHKHESCGKWTREYMRAVESEDQAKIDSSYLLLWQWC